MWGTLFGFAAGVLVGMWKVDRLRRDAYQQGYMDADNDHRYARRLRRDGTI